MWEQLIVAAIVLAALLHFCTKYLPAAWRRQIVYFLARRGFDENRMARLFKVKGGGGGGCGSGCDSCGSCDTPAPSVSAPSDAPKQRVITLHVQR